MDGNRDAVSTPKQPRVTITGLRPETAKALSLSLGTSAALARQAESIRKMLDTTGLTQIAEQNRRMTESIRKALDPTREMLALTEATRKSLATVLTPTLPKTAAYSFPQVEPPKPIRIPPRRDLQLEMLTDTRDAVRELTAAVETLARLQAAVLTELQSQTEEERRPHWWEVTGVVVGVAVLLLTTWVVFQSG